MFFLGSMSDLIGFEGFFNEMMFFWIEEYKVLWKFDCVYFDFFIGNEYNEICDYFEFWYEDGKCIKLLGFKGCYNSDFDQYGDIEVFGVFFDWQCQLVKFVLVQDCFCDWYFFVVVCIEYFFCMVVRVLDIDVFCIDKVVQVMVDVQVFFSFVMCKCVIEIGKINFVVFGEIMSGNMFGFIYIGCGCEFGVVENLYFEKVMNMDLDWKNNQDFFVWEFGNSVFDGGVFYYFIYCFMMCFFGFSGYFQVGFDLFVDWVMIWYEMFKINDMYNVNMGKFDFCYFYGVINQDVFCWLLVVQGMECQLFVYFIIMFVFFGVFIIYYGEEQVFYVFDGMVVNYVFGCQVMVFLLVWKVYGCFQFNVMQYIGWFVEKGCFGCQDDGVVCDYCDFVV